VTLQVNKVFNQVKLRSLGWVLIKYICLQEGEIWTWTHIERIPRDEIKGQDNALLETPR
jgi:hypothetical protein